MCDYLFFIIIYLCVIIIFIYSVLEFPGSWGKSAVLRVVDVLVDGA